MEALRQCAQCSASFEPARAWASFCGPACKRRFHDIDGQRGKIALPLMIAWRSGKRGRSEDSAYALNQLAALADKWAREDKANGRDSTRVVAAKRRDGWQAADLT